MLRIGLHGASGKMCKSISNLAEQDKNIEITYAYSRKQNNDLKKLFTLSDIIIDFSNYKAINLLIDKAFLYKKPLIIGTTNLPFESINKIQELGKHIPVFYAPNMSLGIYVVRQMLKIACKMLEADQYDINIIETHHKFKQDSPSGTALMLDHEIRILNRKANTSSIRAGFEFGTHEILFTSEFENITIKHQATSRKIFAHSAIAIAKWLNLKPAGFYQVEDYFQKN